MGLLHPGGGLLQARRPLPPVLLLRTPDRVRRLLRPQRPDPLLLLRGLGGAAVQRRGPAGRDGGGRDAVSEVRVLRPPARDHGSLVLQLPWSDGRCQEGIGTGQRPWSMV